MFANLTLYFDSQFDYIIDMERFDGMLKSVSCDNIMVLEFRDASSFSRASEIWNWVNDDIKNNFILVAQEDKCGSGTDRRPYIINNARFDAASFNVMLDAQGKKWEDVAQNFTFHMGYAPGVDSSTAGLLKRDADVTLDLASNFNKNLFHEKVSGVDLSVDCSNCGTKGKLLVDFDLDVGWKGPTATMKVNPQDVAAFIGLTMAAKGTLSKEYNWEKTLVSVPIEGIKVGDWAKIGAFLDVEVGFSMEEWTGDVKVGFGAQMGISNAAVVQVSITDPSKNSFSGWNPALTALPFDLDAKVSGAAQVYAQPSISLSASAFKWGIELSLDLRMPYIELDFDAMVNTGGVCGTQKTIGVNLGASSGVDLSVQVAKTGQEANPLWEKSLFNQDWPLFQKCYAFGASNAQPGGGSSGGGGGGGGVQKPPKSQKKKPSKKPPPKPKPKDPPAKTLKAKPPKKTPKAPAKKAAKKSITSRPPEKTDADKKPGTTPAKNNGKDKKSSETAPINTERPATTGKTPAKSESTGKAKEPGKTSQPNRGGEKGKTVSHNTAKSTPSAQKTSNARTANASKTPGSQKSKTDATAKPTDARGAPERPGDNKPPTAKNTGPGKTSKGLTTSHPASPSTARDAGGSHGVTSATASAITTSKSGTSTSSRRACATGASKTKSKFKSKGSKAAQTAKGSKSNSEGDEGDQCDDVCHVEPPPADLKTLSADSVGFILSEAVSVGRRLDKRRESIKEVNLYCDNSLLAVLSSEKYPGPSDERTWRPVPGRFNVQPWFRPANPRNLADLSMTAGDRPAACTSYNTEHVYEAGWVAAFLQSLMLPHGGSGGARWTCDEMRAVFVATGGGREGKTRSWAEEMMAQLGSSRKQTLLTMLTRDENNRKALIFSDKRVLGDPFFDGAATGASRMKMLSNVGRAMAYMASDEVGKAISNTAVEMEGVLFHLGEELVSNRSSLVPSSAALVARVTGGQQANANFLANRHREWLRSWMGEGNRRVWEAFPRWADLTRDAIRLRPGDLTDADKGSYVRFLQGGVSAQASVRQKVGGFDVNHWL